MMARLRFVCAGITKVMQGPVRSQDPIVPMLLHVLLLLFQCFFLIAFLLRVVLSVHFL